jgi:hypothetical protein
MRDKSKEILECVKLHLKEEREEFYRLQRDNDRLAEQRSIKYNFEQVGITLSLIERLENMYTAQEYKQAPATIWDADFSGNNSKLKVTKYEQN